MWRITMYNIMIMIFFIIISIVGGGLTLFLVLSLPAIIVWKIWRHFRYGYKITD